MTKAIYCTLFTTSFVGTLFCGALASVSVSYSLPAVLFGIAGLGFAFISIYFIFVLSEVENNK